MNKIMVVVTSFLLTAGFLGTMAAPDSELKMKDGQVIREFTITGMTCGGCAAGVKMTVKRLEGVSRVEASYDDGSAVVTFDPAKTSAGTIIAAIEKLGYKAVVKRKPATEDG